MKDNNFSIPPFPLSQAQISIWMDEKIRPGTSIYNNCALLELDSIKSIEDLIDAWKYPLLIFKSFWLRIMDTPDGPRQYYDFDPDFKIKVIDYSTLNDGEKKAHDFINSKAKKNINVNGERLFDSFIILCPKGKALAFCKTHHIISDGHSGALFYKHVLKKYSLGSRFKLFCHTHDYSKFVSHELDFLKSTRAEKSKGFWIQNLKDPPEALFHDTWKNEKLFTGKSTSIPLGTEKTRNILDFCHKRNISPTVFFQTIVYLLFSRSMDRRDIILGTNFMNRIGMDFKNMIGMFASTVPLRIIEENNAADFSEILEIVSRTFLQCRRHQSYPYNKIITDRNKLFNVLVNFEPMWTKESDKTEGLHFSIPFSGGTPHDLSILFHDRLLAGYLSVEAHYLESLFDKSEIKKLLENIAKLISVVLLDPLMPLTTLDAPLIQTRKNIKTIHSSSSSSNKKEIASVWKKILNVEDSISNDDNFFSLGGDSIKAIRLVSRLKQADYEVDVMDIFTTPLFIDFSKKITKKTPACRHDEPSSCVLPPTQNQQYLFKTVKNNIHLYNHEITFKIDENMDTDEIRKRWNRIIKKHDSLRIHFKKDADSYQQIINSPKEIPITVYAVDDTHPPLNIHKAPLFRLVFDKKEHSLTITAHHLIIDVLSWSVILDDFFDDRSSTSPDTSYRHCTRQDSTMCHLVSNNHKRKKLYCAFETSNNKPSEKSLIELLNRSLDDLSDLQPISTILERHGRSNYNMATTGWFTSFEIKPNSNESRYVLFNYLGELDNRIKNIRLVKQDNETSPYLLEINCYHQKGRFFISLEYDSDMVSKKDAHQLLDEFQEGIIHTTFVDVYQLTPLQQGMYFHLAAHPDSNAYFEQLCIELGGNFNQKAFLNAVELVINKHQALRSVITEIDHSPYLGILKKFDLKPEIKNNVTEKELESIKAGDLNTPFNPEEKPPLRITIIKTNDGRNIMLWSHHHIILDGWSLGIILSDLLETYNNKAGCAEKNSPAPLYEWINSRRYEDDLKFWKDKLSTFESSSDLPKCMPLHGEKELKRLNFDFDTCLTLKTSEFCKRNSITINTFIRGLWTILLSKYSGRDDMTYGITISGRSPEIPEAEKFTGMFINTIPERVTLEKDNKFCEFLSSLQTSFIHAEKHGHCPLSYIQKDHHLGANLFDHLLVFENYPLDKTHLSSDGSKLYIKNISLFEMNEFPFTIVIRPEEQIHFEIQYLSRFYPDHFITSIRDHLLKLASQMISFPKTRLRNIDILTENEKSLILEKFNNHTTENYKNDIPAHILFERQTSLTPDANALVFHERVLTYRELNTRSNQLAHYLREKFKSSANRRIGIYLDRNFNMIIALLAILKSGAGYVPISPQYPDERKKYMITDSDIEVILSETGFQNELSIFERPVIFLDNPEPVISRMPETNPKHINNMEDLVYLIYTSGSTGKPKGVMQNHRSVCNMLLWKKHHSKIDHRLKTLFFTSISFDVSFEEIFTTLTNGGELYIVDEETRNHPDLLAEFVHKNNINIVSMPFSYLNLLFDKNSPTYDKILKSDIRYIIHGGEPFNVTDGISDFLKAHPQTVLHNNYGPSETHMVTSHTLSRENYSSIPVGRPLTKCRIYILSDDLRTVPIHVPGEIYIGGEQVGIGYFGNQTLTNDRFVSDPFVNDKNAKMYKTGDLGRFLENGEIEYIARSDHQVKIRGNRVELTEVESHLLGITGIKEAAVTAQTDSINGTALVAWYVGSNDLSVNDLRQKLSSTLPDYMIPSYFVQLKKLPRTPNGKLDRNGLSNISPQKSESTFEEPKGDTEQKLATIWREILKLKKIDRHTSFFDLGGHSLKALRIISMIYGVLKKKITLKEFLDHPTISHSAAIIDKKEDNVHVPIRQTHNTKNFADLSPAQRRIWAVNNLDSSGKAYILSGVFQICGKFPKEIFEKRMNKIIANHEIMRTRFTKTEAGTPRQEILHSFELKVKVIDLSDLDTTNDQLDNIVDNEANQAFDLEAAPPIRAVFIKTGPENGRFVLCIHHIISDEWSIRLILESLTEDTPPSCDIQYRDLVSEKTDFDYWEKIFQKPVHEINLFQGIRRRNIQKFTGRSKKYIFSKNLSHKLERVCSQFKLTPFVALISSVVVLISRLGNTNDITFGTPSLGRDDHATHSMLGVFINMLALRFDIDQKMSFADVLKESKNIVSDAFEHQNAPFDRIIERLGIKRSPGRSPLFDIMVVLADSNPQEEMFTIENTDFKRIPSHNKSSKYDLSFYFSTDKDQLKLDLEYNSTLLPENYIDSLIQSLDSLLDDALTSPELNIYELSILSKKHHEFWNKTNLTENHGHNYRQTVIEVIEKTVKAHPENIALEYPEGQLSYKELWEKSTSLSNLLIHEYGLKPQTNVALCLPRSPEMVVSILAVLMAGCAYVPIDPNFPIERIDKITDDSNTPFILVSTNKIQTDLPYIKVELEKLTANTDNVKIKNDPDSLAYIIYTSGSTGNPKGVMIKNSSVLNRIFWMKDYLTVSPSDTILQKTNYTFDVSVWEFFLPLISGAKLVIPPPGDEKDPWKIARCIREHDISIIHFVPSMLREFLDAVNNEDIPRFEPLRYVIASGENLTSNLVKKYYSKLASPLYNLYGPTEATVDVTAIKTTTDMEVVPIGNPVDNTKIYVLDDRKNLLPTGIKGQIYLSGMGLAVGYNNLPELTQKSFSPNPFSNDPEYKAIYATGDLGYLDESGSVVFIGRIDNQIKIRGFRLELGDIESALLEHETVKKAIVKSFATEDEDNLVGYIELENETSSIDLRTYLKGKLPEYMIPHHFVFMDAWPLSTSGKIDRKKLVLDKSPKTAPTVNIQYLPKNQKEKIILDAWKDILETSSVNANDNFFDLGGDSVKAIRIIAKLKDMKLNASLEDILYSQNLAHFNNLTTAQIGVTDFKDNETSEFIPLPTQKTILETSLRYENSPFYNIFIVTSLNGFIDPDRLNNAWKMLHRRHPAMRCVFKNKKGTFLTNIQNDLYFKDISSLSDSDTRDYLEDFITSTRQEPFDIENGPLCKLCLVKLSADNYKIILKFHHLIIDGWGLALLYRDLSNYLQDPEQKITEDITYKNILSKKTDQVHTIKDRFGTYLTTSNFQDLLQTVRHGDERVHSFKLGIDVSNKLRQLARNKRTTVNLLLQLAWALMLKKRLETQKVRFGITSSGRNLEIPGISNCIGLMMDVVGFEMDFSKSADSTDSYLDEQKNKLTQILKSPHRHDYRDDVLFDHVLIFENYPEFIRTDDIFPEVKLHHDYSLDFWHWPLTVVIFPDEDIRVDMNYFNTLIKEDTILNLKSDWLEHMRCPL